MPKGLKGFQKGHISYWRGKIIPEEIRRKMSTSRKRTGAPWRKGMKMSEETKNKIKNKILERKEKFGYINSPETRNKISESLKPYKNEKATNWKGGAINWIKRQVKIRDNYTCQVCGLQDLEIMEVDHIVPRHKSPELYNSIENMMTICPNCHRRKTNKEIGFWHIKKLKNE